MDKSFKAQVRKVLNIFDDYTCKKDGSYVVYRSFFYRMGNTTSTFASFVERLFMAKLEKEITIIDAGEHWVPEEFWSQLKDGDSIRKGSHWHVTFRIKE